MKFDGIIFDLDGTLWDSTEGVCRTWNGVLSNYPQIDLVITPEIMHGCMGLQMDEIAGKLFPELDKEMQMKVMGECCELEDSYLAEHGGIMYPKLEETLAKLSEDYKLFIVSNCQDGYIQSFFQAHHLDKYFSDFESAGKTGMSKGENNKLVMQRNQLANAIYVGDTMGDATSAVVAGIPFVYARYGFGTVVVYDYVIDGFQELLKIFY